MTKFISTTSVKTDNLAVETADFVYYTDTREVFFCIGGGVLPTGAVLVPLAGLLSSIGMQIKDGDLSAPGTFYIRKNADGQGAVGPQGPQGQPGVPLPKIIAYSIALG